MATITTHHKGDMLFETELGTHKLQIDVPASMGGSDRGPTPPEIFVASLGSCVAALVANYCNKAKLNTDGLTVDVTYDKVPDPTRLVNLQVKVHLPNADVSGREKAIERVADRCPVHQTICGWEDIGFEIVGHST
jgi:uncharacterized OsmC-like protein